jgi:DNA modification methylase
METNKIYNQDCIDFLKTLPDCCIDLIIADPPYFQTHGEFDFVFKTEEEYLSWVDKWAKECNRVLKDTGAFYCWGSHKMIDKISCNVLSKYNWIKRDLIVWNFKTGKPEKQGYRKETEFMWFYSKERHLINVEDIRIPYTNGGYEKDKRKNPKGKSCGNVWEFSRIKKNYPEWVDHPTQKPLNLCDRIVKASSKEGDLVYIPFAGSGSEIVSCIKNNRQWIATEIDKKYIDNIIIPRIGGIKNEQV